MSLPDIEGMLRQAAMTHINLPRRISALLAAFVLMTSACTAFAAEVVGQKHFRFSGFATLGLTKGGDEDLGFHRDLDQEGLYDGDWSVSADSLLGVQMDVVVNDQFGGAVQMVGKDRVEDSLENSVEWAFLRYRFNPDWTVRAGRIGFDLFLLSDYRNVGFAYLWTRPPVEFYAPLTFTSFDGADLTWSTYAAGGMFRAKISAGNTDSTLNILDNQVNFEVHDIMTAAFSWESERWQFKLSAVDTKVGAQGQYFPGSEPLAKNLQLALPIWPELVSVQDDIYLSNPHIYYYIFGVAYTRKPWQIQSEISRIDPRVNLYPETVQGYISAGYQVNSLTPYFMVARSESLGEARLVPEPPVIPSAPELAAPLAALQQGVQAIYDSLSSDQTTLTAGLRWDIRYDLALKVQLDHSRVGQRGLSLWEVRSAPMADKKINTFSINLNCIF